MAEVKNKAAQLLSEAKEYVKQHIIFDAQNRTIAVYTAPNDASQGDKCSITRYKYLNATSNVIVNRFEDDATWDPNSEGDWDQLEPLP